MSLGPKLFTIVVAIVLGIVITIAYLDTELDQYLIVMIVSHLSFSWSVYIMSSMAVTCVSIIFIISIYLRFRFNEIVENIRIYERSGKLLLAE